MSDLAQVLGEMATSLQITFMAIYVKKHIKMTI